MMMMMIIIMMMMMMKMCAEAETGDNNDELQRQTGRPVSYGDVIQVKYSSFTCTLLNHTTVTSYR